MEDPAQRPRILHHIALLRERSLRTLEALHYLRTAEGYHCLDVNLVAASEQELDMAVIELLHGYSSGRVLPCAALRFWMRMLEADLVSQRVLRGAPHRVGLVVVLCSEVS